MTIAFKVAPSILAADFTRLGEQIQGCVAGGAELLHCDVMDGHFVPNISFGPMIVEAARRVTSLPLDTHLMITDPDKYIPMTAKAGATMIDFHIEVSKTPRDTVKRIRDLGVKVGLAFNPETPFSAIRDLLPELDRVLVMTVHPGFGGQAFLYEMLPKIKEVADAVQQLGRPIEIGIDGGVDLTTTPTILAHGGNVLIAGSMIFKNNEGIPAAIHALKAVKPGA